ncbi:hypothetical protein OH77DRAFT_839703 [Trametes cingulata]|nr:hypothetical protein OH77DRAFT_839703 [Trametes cingulata]
MPHGGSSVTKLTASSFSAIWSLRTVRMRALRLRQSHIGKSHNSPKWSAEGWRPLPPRDFMSISVQLLTGMHRYYSIWQYIGLSAMYPISLLSYRAASPHGGTSQDREGIFADERLGR